MSNMVSTLREWKHPKLISAMSRNCAISQPLGFLLRQRQLSPNNNGAVDEATQMELALAPTPTKTLYSTMSKLVVGFDGDEDEDSDSDDDNGT
jgi:hypothetical protein